MIKVPYTVTPDISKYEGAAFNTNPDKVYLEQKRRELNTLGSELGFTLLHGHEFVKDLSEFCGFKPTNSITEIALQLEEDIAILYDGKLVSMLFCFPSGFKPTEKVGMSFAEMHAPVADSETLIKMADKVIQVISRPGSQYRRNVWTLTSSPRLSRHPHYVIDEPVPQSISDLYFRKETQTTVGMGDGRTVFFFVKVEVEPLEKIWQDEEMRAKIVSSINSMTDATLMYKGLRRIKQIINDLK